MPRRRLCASFVFVLLLAALQFPSVTHGTPAGHLLITEVMYDPAAPEPGGEWIELLNPTASAQSLSGWSLRDNTATDALPDFMLEPGQYAVLASNADDFLAANPGYGGVLVALGSPIGNGLSNSGDALTLVDSSGALVDAISYGNDTSALDPPCPDADEGLALARFPSDTDSDAAADWSVAPPSPGGPATPPPPTVTATETTTATSAPSATATPSPTDALPDTPTFTPTPVPTTPDTTPTATNPPAPRLLISEIYYDAPQTGSEGKYEWIEIHNPGAAAVSTKGWRIEDNSATDAVPETEIPPRGFLVIAASADGFAANFPSFSALVTFIEGTIGNGLSNSGDRVRLLAPDDSAADEMSYGDDKSVFDPPCPTVKPGESLARVPAASDTGEAVDWVRQTLPSPGDEGVIPTATPSATATRSPTPSVAAPGSTATSTRTPTATRAATRTVTPSRTMTVTRTPTNTRTPTRTPSPTPTATPTRGGEWPGLLLSEVMYDPLEEGTDADWEWIEVWNPSGETVSMSGWLVADSAGQDRLPETGIGAGERIVIAARAARFRERYPAYAGALVALDGNIGNGLSNTGDSVGLVAPDGSIIDAMSYGSDKTVFDPACKDVKAGQSLGRLVAEDSDTSEDWAAQEEPGPGEPSRLVAPTPTHTATPTPTDTSTTRTPTATATAPTPSTSTPLPPEAFAVTLNEILPDPASIDWDRDGDANFADEWIELHNASALPVPLAGWTISDEAGAYTLPAGMVIWPRGFLLLYRGQTRLALSDWRDTVTLTRSDGSLGDRLTYERGPGDDQTFCRLPDGSGGWSGDCEVTPGEANRARPAPPPAPPGSPQPTATPRARAPQTVRAARLAPVDARVTVTGALTLPPGLIDKAIYLQDATGGIKIYLRKGEYPPLKAGDEVKVTGWTRDFHGETELSVPDPSYLSVVGPGQPPAARFLSAKEVGEDHEGELVQVAGFVVKFAPRGLTLRDKTGQVEIYFPESLPWRRPYVNMGDLWAAQGVASQYQSERGAGYRIIPRFRADVTNGPLGLPVTGAANGLAAQAEEQSAE